MKVALLPYAGDQNPYMKLLANSLKALGVKPHLIRSDAVLPLWRAYLEQGRPDIIHLQWQHGYLTGRPWPKAVLKTFLFFAQWFPLRVAGVRFVWTVHNVINHEGIQAEWELGMCRLLARVVDERIVLCDAARLIVAAAYRIPPERIQVVPHGHLDRNWYPPPMSKLEARRALELPVDGFVLLHFGRIRAYKGLDHLLDAFAALPLPHIQLVLVGQPYPASLERSLSDKTARDPRVITHFGFVDNEALIAYISACDAVVLPYIDVLASTAATLTASCGRALVMPKSGCMQEFPTEAAILYDPQAPDPLKTALERALSAPLEAMGAAARDYVTKTSWNLVAARTLEVYRTVLGQGKESTALAASHDRQEG